MWSVCVCVWLGLLPPLGSLVCVVCNAGLFLEVQAGGAVYAVAWGSSCSPPLLRFTSCGLCGSLKVFAPRSGLPGSWSWCSQLSSLSLPRIGIVFLYCPSILKPVLNPSLWNSISRFWLFFNSAVFQVLRVYQGFSSSSSVKAVLEGKPQRGSGLHSLINKCCLFVCGEGGMKEKTGAWKWVFSWFKASSGETIGERN